MKKFLQFCILLIVSFIFFSNSYSQTSWTGNANTNWNNSGNWTAGVPNSNTDAILGNASFTGGNQPTVNASSSCKTLTIGGTVVTTLTLNKNLVVNGNVTINTNGTVTQPNSTLTLKGNWINNGTYTTTSGSAKIVFGGTAQLIAGSATTTFRRVTVNTGTVVTLGTNVTASGTSSYFYIYGTFDPGQSPTYTLTSTINFRVFNNGKIKVNAATFASNYILSGSVTLYSGCIVDYSSTTVNQTISSSYTYSTLIISGTGIKSLAANLPSLYSTSSGLGNIIVNSGTLNLSTFTANRGTTTLGGELKIANGAFLLISGTSNFPANYNTRTLSLASTVEYNGTAQTISAQTFGNLVLSSGSGAATKTFPATSFTIEGDFTSRIGAGTSVTYTTASNINFNGSVNILTSTTFNGGSNTHTIRGNWINNGTFTGSTGSVSFDQTLISISGTGNQNFNNINFLQAGITATGNINVSGNIYASTVGQFTHNSGGLLTMTGSSKTITGTDMIFNDLTVSGTISTNTSFVIQSNLAVSGSFTCSSGTISMPGTSKTISGAGTLGFRTLEIPGSVSTASNFSIDSLLDISGSFLASTGTASFTGSSQLSGTANLYNVTLNCTSMQMSTNSILGIGNTFTITAGTLNVTSNLPNTVIYNGAVAQTIRGITYHNLTLSNGNTKTAAGNITINGSFINSASTTFAASTFTHTILRNWINNGIFTASTSTIQFTGASNASITGATTFNVLTINKNTSTNTVTLINDIISATVNMTTGKMLTGTKKITITNTRSGNGIILGTITRTHAYSTGVSYTFEGPENRINFSSATAVTSITVTVIVGGVTDFPNESSINREYNISVTGTSYNATLRLHYEDAELNGNNEANMSLWNKPSTWNSVGKNSNSIDSNYIEKTGLTNISYRWTCAEVPGVVRWTGAASSAWTTAGNWTVVSGSGSTPPSSTDNVQLGTAAFTNQPTISSPISVKGISFGSVQATNLTLVSGGSLTVNGNVSGALTADITHTINSGNQNLTINGNLNLSSGVMNRSINLIAGTGTVSVLGTVFQRGNSSIIYSGAGNLNIGGDFVYESGIFTAAASTVKYNGSVEQAVAAVQYNNLTINKPAGSANLATGLTVNNDLTISSGELDIDSSTIIVNGNVTINTGAILDCNVVYLNVKGNWTNTGTYLSTTGIVTLDGTGTQTIFASPFNNLTINKTSGTVNLAGNLNIASNLIIQAGIINLATFTANRATSGGIFSMAAGTVLEVSGANNFPANFTTNNLNSSSLVHYKGTVAQTVRPLVYGDLTFSNGGANAKTQSANITIKGNLTINSGATFHSGGNITTLSGNWTNNGSFIASTGNVLLNGVSKTISGNTDFFRLTLNGTYVVAGSNINYNGQLVVNSGASYNAGTGIANVNSDLTNSGSITSSGTTNFAGTSVQTIRLLNSLLSTSTGIVNFNGNVSPVLNSTTSPQFATLNINNTAGVTPSVNWTVFVAMNVNAGGIFNGGISDHTIYGSFSNAGTVTSTGSLNFRPVSAKTIALGSSGFTSDGIIDFGGSGQLTITGTPGALNAVIISNTNSAGVTMPSNLTIDSNFVITAGAIFNAGIYTYTIGGNIECDGVLNGESSTFITTGPATEITVSAEAVFNNFTNTGFLSPQNDYRVAGNFANNGTYDGSFGVLIMVGNAPATIGGTTIPSTMAQLTIEKTDNAVVTQAVNISNVMFLNIFSGVLFTSTFTLTQDVGGGLLVINDDATLRLAGTNTLPVFSAIGLDDNSYVDYAGVATTQLIGNAAIYGNLIVSGTGTKNATAGLTVLGNLTISNGTFNTSTLTLTHSIAGNFIMTGGTIAGTNATYLLNGPLDQHLNLLSSLPRLTINKTDALVNLGSNVTVTLSMTFTAGKIQTGNYTLIIPSGGTVAGAAQSTGWVIGNLQKNVATGSSVSRTFEIGGSMNYSPATYLFASVSTAGNLIGKSTDNDHTEINYSGLDSAKSVNRFWTFTNSGIVFTTATATYNWIAADFDAGAITANFKVARYNGSSWSLPTTASPLSTSIQATGLTGFGVFSVAERLTIYRWSGEALTADWGTAKNWAGGVPTTTYATVIPNGIPGGRVYPVLGTGTGTVNNLTIESTSSLTVSNATLQIAGSVTNNGNFSTLNGTIEFNGSTAQSIPAGLFANNTIKNLFINNNVSLNGTDTLTGTLTITTGKTFTTNDFLNLKSNASGTARIATLPVDGSGNATAFITGNVGIERYIPMRKAWRLLSAPVKSTGAPTINAAWQEGLTTASPNPNLYPGYGVKIQGGTTANGFDQGLTASPTIKVFNNTTGSFTALPASGTYTPITNYQGYFLYLRGDRSVDLMQGNSAVSTTTTLRMKGQINTGKQIINVNGTGYTILGNPFPSAIDFETLTRANVKNSFYVWDPKLSGTNGLGGYVTFSWNSGTGLYDATTSVSPLSKFIQSGEAIIIQSLDGINPGTVTIKESDKTANGSDAVFGRPNGLNQQIRVNLISLNTDASASLIDGVLTTYDDDNSNTVNNEDASKLNGGSENIGIKREGVMLAIERRKTVTTCDTTFLNLYQMKLNNYQLEITASNMNRTGITAVIKDNYLVANNDMPLDMNGTTKVNFSINADPASYAINRFSIVLRPSVVLPVTIRSVKAYRQQKDIVVEWKTESETNIKEYEVERSADGRNFIKIKTTVATATNGGSAAYKITDSNPMEGNNYYRIRSMELDGRSGYSNIVKVAMELVKETPSVVVYPNPVVGNTISLQLNHVEKGNYTMQLFNAAGQLVARKTLQYNGQNGPVNFEINGNEAVGKYNLKVTGEGIKINTAVIKR